MINEFYVKVPSTFMHASPKISSESTDELLFGTRLFSICERPDEEVSDMLYCETSYGYRGFVKRQHLARKIGTNRKTEYTVISRFCDVLPLPEYKFKPILTLPMGSIVEKSTSFGEVGGFTDVEISGRRMFVRASCIKPRDELTKKTCEEEKRIAIVNTALSYLGTPYRHGGKSTSGIDCSGLCFMAYSINGIGLWRDSLPDTNFVTQIEKHELKQADLIYCKGHVTMYIGADEYIHSSATLGGVTISSFDKHSPCYYDRLTDGIIMCARSTAFDKNDSKDKKD
jgi:hypothetical protein